MTVRIARSPTSRSGDLHGIPEETGWSFAPTESGSYRRENSPRRSLPTEYQQSFRRSSGPRPRNPGNGWQARNISNILPSEPVRPPQPPRASRRPPPEIWLARHANSQIFPSVDPPPSSENGNDINNNPPAPPPIVAGGRRRTGRWPWQARAQASSIFESENRPAATLPRHHVQFPWQERALKSVIFEVLAGLEVEPKQRNRRTYEWDQRQSTQISEAVHRKPTETSSRQHYQEPKLKTSQEWPWQERARQSEVFGSPDKPSCPRPVNFVWDQRRSRFSVKLDPAAHFPKGSSYKDNYIQWQKEKTGKGVLPAAGKPCYTDEGCDKDTDKGKSEINPGGGKKKFKGRQSDSKIVLALPAPPLTIPEVSSKAAYSKVPLKRSGSNIKGETCLDLVPLGYRFSNHSNQSSGRSSRKVRF